MLIQGLYSQATVRSCGLVNATSPVHLFLKKSFINNVKG